MEQFYYFSDAFLKARFNVAELRNYVLIEYINDKKCFLSLGRRINATQMQYKMFIDLRRGKLCNPYNEVKHKKCCRILGRVQPEFVAADNEIVVRNMQNDIVLRFDYQDIEALYKECWNNDEETIQYSLCSTLRPFSCDAFYARHFNISIERLRPRVILYEQKTISVGYAFESSAGVRFLDICTAKIIRVDSQKHTLFEIKGKHFFKPCLFRGKPSYSFECEDKAEGSGISSFVINIFIDQLDTVYRSSWYTPDITRRGWTHLRQYEF